MEVTLCVCVSLVHVITFKFTDDDYETTKYFEHGDVSNDV
jgi:hypothetical protein